MNSQLRDVPEKETEISGNWCLFWLPYGLTGMPFEILNFSSHNIVVTCSPEYGVARAMRLVFLGGHG